MSRRARAMSGTPFLRHRTGHGAGNGFQKVDVRAAAPLGDGVGHGDIRAGVAREHRQQHGSADARTCEDAAPPAPAGREGVEGAGASDLRARRRGRAHGPGAAPALAAAAQRRTPQSGPMRPLSRAVLRSPSAAAGPRPRPADPARPPPGRRRPVRAGPRSRRSGLGAASRQEVRPGGNRSFTRPFNHAGQGLRRRKTASGADFAAVRDKPMVKTKGLFTIGA